MNTEIVVYLSTWHLKQSMAFQEVVVNPLKAFADIRVEVFDGEDLPPNKFDEATPAIFCMILPPHSLLNNPRAKLVWVPMWDWVYDNRQSWWNSLPKSLRIVAFSDIVAGYAQRAGLKVLKLHYYKNPEVLEPAKWNHERTLFYWNRIGLIGPTFLERLCAELKVQKLLFREKTDAHSKKHYYQLPERLGNTHVSGLPDWMPQDEFLQVTSTANIYIAPRIMEGIGVYFLEGLARGCAVFGCDSPTMNEYILHGENGYLWQVRQSQTSKIIDTLFFSQRENKWDGKGTLFLRKVGAIRRYLKYYIQKHQSGYLLDEKMQDWDKIADLDLTAMGKSARRSQQEGFQNWQKHIVVFADFVLNG